MSKIQKQKIVSHMSSKTKTKNQSTVISKKSNKTQKQITMPAVRNEETVHPTKA